MTGWMNGCYDHERVNHGAGEYARDDDGDGFYEVHREYNGRLLVTTPKLDSAHIGVSHRRNFLFISDFSSSFIMLVSEGNPFFTHSY